VLFGLCVAVFCQHEILSPLEDFRGGRATAPGIWRRLWFPRTSGESWVLAGGLVGMFDPGLSEFPPIMGCLLGPFLYKLPLGAGEAGWTGAAGQERGCLGFLLSKLVDHWPLSLADTLLLRPRGQALGLP